MIRSLSRLIVFIVVLLMAIPAQAKRMAPKVAQPVVSDGVEYRVIHDRYPSNGAPQGIRAFVEARDTMTQGTLWRVEVYDVSYRPDLETDVQDVYIENLKLDPSGILATDERQRSFRIDLKNPVKAVQLGTSDEANTDEANPDEANPVEANRVEASRNRAAILFAIAIASFGLIFGIAYALNQSKQ